MLASGMTVVEAVETTRLIGGRGAAGADVQTKLLGLLHEGKSLSQAMREVGSFSPVLIASVTASERTSKLLDALDEYLQYEGLMSRLRGQLISAAIYPALVVSLGVLISLFLLMFVMPRFARIYSDSPAQVGEWTHAVLSLSAMMKAHPFWLPLALACFGAAVWFAWRRGWVHAGVRWLVGNVPVFRTPARDFALARLYHSLALMFKGGYTLEEAMGVCETLALGAGTPAAISRARAGISRGQRVADAMASAGLTDPVVERLLAVGERSGGFGLVLQTVAERHGANFTTFVERATRVAEPLLLLMVALMVGGIVVMMYMPIFDMAGQIGGAP